MTGCSISTPRCLCLTTTIFRAATQNGLVNWSRQRSQPIQEHRHYITARLGAKRTEAFAGHAQHPEARTSLCSVARHAAKAPCPSRGTGNSLAHSMSGLLKYTGTSGASGGGSARPGAPSACEARLRVSTGCRGSNDALQEGDIHSQCHCCQEKGSVMIDLQLGLCSR